MAVVEQSDIKTRIQESNNYSRSASLTDSSERKYQLTIFPVDTFHFSLQNGFIVKASKVVLTGSGKQVVRLTDSSKFASLLTSELERKFRKDSTLNMKKKSVAVERRGAIWHWIASALFVGIVILVTWWKSLDNITNVNFLT